MIYLVRHGQTDWNLNKRFNGVTDSKLNCTGIEQSKLHAKNLKNIHFDICLCSPLYRAKQTCEIICNDKINFDNRLIEVNCGEFEGMEENAESMKSFWQAIRTGVKGTESLKDFIKRNCDFCDMILNEHNGKNILIVTHAANMRVINYYFMKKPKDYDFTKAVGESGGVIIYDKF